MALEESQKVYEEDKDERAKEAAIRYESRPRCLSVSIGKLPIIKRVRDFMIYDPPDGLWTEKLLIFSENMLN